MLRCARQSMKIYDNRYNLIGCGAEVLLLACTELSIIGRKIRSTVKIFDSAQILAESIIREARKTR